MVLVDHATEHLPVLHVLVKRNDYLFVMMRWPLRQFLADWPLVYVASMRWDTFRGIATISYRQIWEITRLCPPR